MMGADGIQREAGLTETDLQRKSQRCCCFIKAPVRISARKGALAEQSSIYLTCLNKSSIPLSAVL